VRIRFILLLLPLLGLLVVACGGTDDGGNSATETGTSSPQQITLTAQDITFSPMQITVKAGTPIHLELINEGALEHDFTAPGLNLTDEVVEPADDHATETEHAMGELAPATVHVAAAGGGSESVDFTARPGTIEFYCSVPGHREAGMVGTIVVE
jgi:uncharacterized cupredoxin-like copper-binding protein